MTFIHSSFNTATDGVIPDGGLLPRMNPHGQMVLAGSHPRVGNEALGKMLVEFIDSNFRDPAGNALPEGPISCQAIIYVLSAH